MKTFVFPLSNSVHACQVVGGNVLLLSLELANTVRSKLVAYVEQERAGAAGKVEHLVELVFTN